MNRKTMILLAVAITVALVTALMIRGRIHQAPPAVVETNNTKVLVATAPIPAGSFVRPDVQLGWQDVPNANVQTMYLTQANTRLEDFAGAVARRSINKGEPITNNILVRTSEGGFMSAVLNPGMRAVTISVNPTSGNAGFVFPGDKVDLIVTHEVSATQNNITTSTRVSETFIENVRVLAVDQMLDNPENKAVLAKTVTLEVTPKQAEMINVASDIGKISVSLRSLAAKEAPPVKEGVDGEGTTADELHDPFFLDSMSTQEIERGITSDSEVSPMLGKKVNVIRGNATEKLQFNQE